MASSGMILGEWDTAWKNPVDRPSGTLHGRLIGRTPDSGSGKWRFESSLCSAHLPTSRAGAMWTGGGHRRATTADALSSSGRTPGFESGDGGSNPPGAARNRTTSRGRHTHGACMSPKARSSSGLGHLTFNQEIAGSNPVRATSSVPARCARLRHFRSARVSSAGPGGRLQDPRPDSGGPGRTPAKRLASGSIPPGVSRQPWKGKP